MFVTNVLTLDSYIILNYWEEEGCLQICVPTKEFLGLQLSDRAPDLHGQIPCLMHRTEKNEKKSLIINTFSTPNQEARLVKPSLNTLLFLGDNLAVLQYRFFFFFAI